MPHPLLLVMILPQVGTYNTLKILADEAGSSRLGFGAQIFLNLWLLRAGSYATSTAFNTYKETHAFIPTKSALAFKGTNLDLAENVYPRNLVCTGETPFNTYFGGLTNLEHVEITPDIAHFAIDEITGTQRLPSFQGNSSNAQISGPSLLCSSSTYTVNNPAGTTVTWLQPLPVGSATLVANGNQATVTRVQSGPITLRAQINDCVTIPVTKTVSDQINVPPVYYRNTTGPDGTTYQTSISNNSTTATMMVPTGGYEVLAYPQESGTILTWSVTQGSYGYYNFSTSGDNCSFTLDPYAYYPTVALQLTATNGSCPAVYANPTFIGTPSYNMYSISPNPANNDVTVSSAETQKTASSKATITAINIYDQQGNLKRYQKYNKVNKATINISTLPTGVYFIEIVNGSYKERQQLSILK